MKRNFLASNRIGKPTKAQVIRKNFFQTFLLHGFVIFDALSGNNFWIFFLFSFFCCRRDKFLLSMYRYSFTSRRYPVLGKILLLLWMLIYSGKPKKKRKFGLEKYFTLINMLSRMLFVDIKTQEKMDTQARVAMSHFPTQACVSGHMDLCRRTHRDVCPDTWICVGGHTALHCC